MRLPLLITGYAFVGALAACGSNSGHRGQPNVGSSSGGPSDGGVVSHTGVLVNPPTATVAPGGTQMFSCTVPGESNMACTWSLQEGTTAGSVGADGTYTATQIPGTYHLVATSSADPTKSGAAVIIVPRNVPDCSMLGAPGVWQNITPPQISLDPNFKIPNGYNQYGVGQYVIDPQDTTTLYLGSCEQGIYKTTDCGATWVHINTGRNGRALDQGMTFAIAIDPMDDKVLYANAGYGMNGLFKSTDGGVNWDNILTPDVLKHVGGFIEGIQIDPANHQHLVVALHEDCKNGVAAGCVLESTNAGTSWTIINGTWGAWGEGSGIDILDSTTWLYAVPFAKPSGIWRTTDSGKTWTQVYNKFPLAGFTRGKNGALYKPDLQGGVLISTDIGVTWSELANSPSKSDAVIAFNGNIYASYGDSGNRMPVQQPYYTASESTPTKWVKFPGPQPPINQGTNGGGFKYDPIHHLLYSSNTLSGFWRIVVQ